MSCRVPNGRPGRPRPGTVPLRQWQMPLRAQCPARAATSALGVADPARRPASMAQTSPSRYGATPDGIIRVGSDGTSHDAIVARTRTPTACRGRPASGEQRAVSVERGLAAEVGIEHRGGGLDFAAVDHVDEPGHGFALIDRVGDHAFSAGGEPHRIEGGVVGDAVGARVVALVQLDLLVVNLALQADEPGGVTRDTGDLVAGLRWPG